jgi:hypothetical protein
LAPHISMGAPHVFIWNLSWRHPFLRRRDNDENILEESP